VVSFAPRPFYYRYPLDRRVGGPWSRYGRGGEEKNPCFYKESNLGRPARSLDTIKTELFRLSVVHKKTKLIRESRLALASYKIPVPFGVLCIFLTTPVSNFYLALEKCAGEGRAVIVHMHRAMKEYRRNGGKFPRVLYLDTRWG